LNPGPAAPPGARTNLWLGSRVVFVSVASVIGLLRFVGVINAALWFGGSVFFTCAVAPAFFSPEMKRFLGEIYSGLAGYLVAERYYILQYVCGSIALVHQLAEWVLLSRPLQRITMTALLTAFGLGLLGGLALQPRINQLHQAAFGRADLFPPAQKAQALHALAVWQGVAACSKYLAAGCLLVYAWRVVNPSGATRFTPTGKFRS
jgi:hypothetical protein